MNHRPPFSIAHRQRRLVDLVGAVDCRPNQSLSDSSFDRMSKPWVAVVTSRLGHNPVLHQDVCRQLSQSMIDCRRRGAVLLVAKGTAIYRWALRAAELFQIPVIEVDVDGGAQDQDRDQGEAQPRLVLTCGVDANLGKDLAMIYLADRVDALYVRQNGTIASAIQTRVETLRDATTRVAVTSLPRCAAKSLIQAGAVGWLGAGLANEPQANFDPTGQPITATEGPDWMQSGDEWLVHCTRACVGPWPGQTDEQYRDDLLLNSSASSHAMSARTPLDTLLRIVRSRRLLASAVASAKAYPVVCFSAVALSELLLSRSYRPHLKRWDYEPWGIAIRRSAVARMGVEQVIYGAKETRREIGPENQFRFQSAGKTYDWTAEREWRSSTDVDLDSLCVDDIRVFVASQNDVLSLQKHSPWRVDVVWQGRPGQESSV